MNITEEILMAFADGELDAAASAEVAAAIAKDPALAARVEEHRQLRAQLQGAFDPVLDERVPDRLLDAAQAPVSLKSTVVDLQQARQQRTAPSTSHWSLPQWAAIAASLLIGLFIGHNALQGSDPIATRDGELVAAGTLANALSTQLSGDAGGEYRVSLTFRDKLGAYCRTFTGTGEQPVTGVACNDHATWKVKAVATAPTANGEYRMAASSMPAAIRAVIDEAMQGEPLSVDAETAARANQWR